MEHDSVLRLRAGPDAFLRSAVPGLTSAGIMTLLASPLPGWVKVTSCLLTLLTGSLVYRWDHQACGLILHIFPDGRVKWTSKSGHKGRGLLSNHSWLVSRYAVVAAVGGAHQHRFIISRSHQIADDYRVLRSWLRLGLPRDASHAGVCA